MILIIKQNLNILGDSIAPVHEYYWPNQLLEICCNRETTDHTDVDPTTNSNMWL